MGLRRSGLILSGLGAFPVWIVEVTFVNDGAGSSVGALVDVSKWLQCVC